MGTKIHFSTKVLVPVVVTMALLLATTVWTVNRRITQQFQFEAARSLATADAVFRNSQKIHTKNLMLRFHNLPNEPRYKAVLQQGDAPTLRDLLTELVGEQGVEVILFTSQNGKSLASAKRDPLIPLDQFESSSATSIHQALTGLEKADTIQVGEKLFDVVSIPVFGVGGHLLGALSFGSELGDATAQEFRLVTRSQIVLLADGRVIVSTLAGPEAPETLARLFNQSLDPSKPHGNRVVPKKILLNEDHYFCAAGKFETLNGNTQLGYLLLTSYEQDLQALHDTQKTLLMVSVFAILVATAFVWWLVRRVTAPLRSLRDSAEAVGKGDFSKRVEVTSADECGELACVFNQMTHNLKLSREELEETVQRLKTTQAHLIQSEKLSGIGEFVAGVAHELNNPLTSVMGFSELLAQGEANPGQKRHLQIIHKSALRCQKIVQSLLSFARRHAPERKLSNVNALVEAAVEFIQYQLRTSNIEVVTSFDPDLPQAMVDPHQVQQVFLNILNNARQAIEAHRPNGRLHIRTETCGQLIRVAFEDDGPGIATENLSKVFDPFFTTKEVGKGTGLGLSLCYGIIKEHGGTITVTSQLGRGATFLVELPLATILECSQDKPEPTVPLESNSREGEGRRVLVIDDEEPILEMVGAALSERGYEVDTARNGEFALKCLGQSRYDLALCDWKMPGLNGQQIYERVRASNPAMSERMIFITGDTINDKTQQFLKQQKRICLAKPFSLVEFRAVIHQALAAS